MAVYPESTAAGVSVVAKNIVLWHILSQQLEAWLAVSECLEYQIQQDLDLRDQQALVTFCAILLSLPFLFGAFSPA